MNVHIQLTEKIQLDEWENHVEGILYHRTSDGQFQLKIKWLGLAEDSREPFDSIAADVQAAIRK